MYIKYENYKFRASTLALIDQANVIIKEYMGKDFNLTLRQLYYQMVARDLIENSQKSYKRIGTTISKARRAGLVDWSAIIDRTRNMKSVQSWASPAQIIRAAISNYHRNRWSNQDNYIEVWIEKDALIGVISGICRELDVPYFACRGYVSDSEMWSAAQRIHGRSELEQDPIIIHLGDHDPSGIDMTRDIFDRIELFAGVSFDVRRIALNMDQVIRYSPPPNPAKVTDSRFDGYLKQYGRESWELDALKPEVLSKLIEDTITEYIDSAKWFEVVEIENNHKMKLRKLMTETKFD